MSSRRNLNLGSGGGAGGYGGGDVGWLWKLLGMDKTEGGPTVDPNTGKVVFSPYTGNNFVSRRVAAGQNQSMLPEIYPLN